MHSTEARKVASALNCSGDFVTEAETRRQAAGKLTEMLLDNPKFLALKNLKELTDRKLNGLSPDLLQFYNKNVALSKQQSVMLASNTASQCEDLWECARKVRVTGTRVYNLYTYTNNTKPDWDAKIRKVFDSGFKGTPDTLYGLENEPKARMAYSEKCSGQVIENGILVHPDVPWLGTSVDGVVVDEFGKPGPIIEIKCIVAGQVHTASELPKLAECCDKTGKLKIKHKYHGQIQLAMLLCGIDKCDFILYASKDKSFVSQCVPYDDKFVFKRVKPLIDIYFDKTLPYLVSKLTSETTEEEEADDIE